MAFDVQQHLPEEAQPFLLKLLARVKHRLHVLHVLWGAGAQLIQSLLVLLLGLRWCDSKQQSQYEQSWEKSTHV